MLVNGLKFFENSSTGKQDDGPWENGDLYPKSGLKHRVNCTMHIYYYAM